MMNPTVFIKNINRIDMLFSTQCLFAILCINKGNIKIGRNVSIAFKLIANDEQRTVSPGYDNYCPRERCQL